MKFRLCHQLTPLTGYIEIIDCLAIYRKTVWKTSLFQETQQRSNRDVSGSFRFPSPIQGLGKGYFSQSLDWERDVLEDWRTSLFWNSCWQQSLKKRVEYMSCWALVEKLLGDIPHSLVVERFSLLTSVIRKTSLQVDIGTDSFSVLAIHPVFFFLEIVKKRITILSHERRGLTEILIPSVPLIRWSRAFPQRTPGSLWPTFVSAWLVSLTVRQASTITL